MAAKAPGCAPVGKNNARSLTDVMAFNSNRQASSRKIPDCRAFGLAKNRGPIAFMQQW